MRERVAVRVEKFSAGGGGRVHLSRTMTRFIPPFLNRSRIRAMLLGTHIALALGIAMPAPAHAAGAEAASGHSAIGNYLAGRHAQAEKDLGSAVTFLSAALRALPKAPDLLRRTFVLMITEGRMEEALPLADRLLGENAKAPIAHLALLVDAIKNDDADQQAARLKSQPTNGLNGFTKPALEAWTQVGAGKVDAGLKTLLALDGKEGSQGLHDMHRALILDYAGRATEAETAYAKLGKDQEQQSFRFTHLLGNLLERVGKANEARALYDAFAKANPGTMLLVPLYARLDAGTKPNPIVATAIDGAAEAIFNIANSLRQQRARETAMVLGRLALWLKPKFPIAQMMVADILDDDDRYEQANAIYLAISSQSPFRFSADIRRASNLNALDQVEPAIALLNGMAVEFAATPQPLITLGDLLRRHERWDEAIVFYTQAIKRVGILTRRHWRMLYSRGIVLERAKRWPEAENDFLRALEFEPDQPYVLNYLGYSWIDQGVHLKRALDMIHNAVRHRPNDGYIIDSLGWVYYRLGNYKKAVLELERAVQIRPEDPIINDHLGDAYWRVGRELEARFQWQRSLSLKPDAKFDVDVRKKLKEGLPPAKPLGAPSESGGTNDPDKT